jgi:hypothetical protein
MSRRRMSRRRIEKEVERGGGDRAKRADNPGLTNPSFRFLF